MSREQLQNLYDCLSSVDNCHLVKDGINGQLMWLTHQSVVDMVKNCIAELGREIVDYDISH